MAYKLVAQQLSTEAGFLLPTRDTVYVLVVFAEVDYTACGGDPYEKQFGKQWPSDSEGQSQVPSDADSLLDPFILPGQAPRGIITRTYAEASFGMFWVLGDYLPWVVRVPCEKLPPRGTQSLRQEVELVLDALPDSIHATAHGLSWQAFDRWRLLPQQAGLPKLRSPFPFPSSYQPRLDVLFIVWRNLAYRLDVQRGPFPCNYGFGLWICDSSIPIGPFSGGVETASSYTTCGTAREGAKGFLVEFFHGLYGGNHWHTAGGAGLHTFPFLPVCRGLSVQGSRPVYAIGYDRWLMGWKPPDKAYVLSAIDETGREVPTDLGQPAEPQVFRVWLRDFMTTGDVLRIRLPYTEKGGPQVKHQYLWLENRRFISSTEEWRPFSSGGCESHPPPPLKGFPGLYGYVQVGKDIREGVDIYSADPSHPNGLGSWIYPLTAEGNYDFSYRWTEKGWALDKVRSLPNPFTGMNDFYQSWDADGDGKIYPTGEGKGSGWLEWKGDSACASWYSWGDEEDAWGPLSKASLSIETNPAPVPVLTLRSEEGYRFPTRAAPAPYDNRRIWLNGLQIEILQERLDGALLVQVRWDGFEVRRTARWCGDIRLSPNPFDAQMPALSIKGTVVLDRSYSPMYGIARGYDSLMKKYWFSDTTQLVIESGAELRIEKRGKLILRGGSKLILLDGARLTGQGWVEVEPGGQLLGVNRAEPVRVRYRRRPYPILLP